MQPWPECTILTLVNKCLFLKGVLLYISIKWVGRVYQNNTYMPVSGEDVFIIKSGLCEPGDVAVPGGYNCGKI